MYRTTITLVVLSEEPIPDDLEISGVAWEWDKGDYVLASDDRKQVELNDEQMSAALTAAGSDPSFFMIGEEA